MLLQRTQNICSMCMYDCIMYMGVDCVFLSIRPMKYSTNFDIFFLFTGKTFLQFMDNSDGGHNVYKNITYSYLILVQILQKLAY